jgi:hypothetical protein
LKNKRPAVVHEHGDRPNPDHNGAIQMAKATRVLSTPPTNTSATNPPRPVDPTRRHLLTVAAGGAVAALPIAAAAAGAAAQTLDAELIELGARFEPLVDRYYAAHRRWSASLAKAHAEHDREFGDPADRDYEHSPEISKAFSDSCERSGAHEADDALSAICDEMRPLETAINAASVNSIEGLRAKALVAYREVSPLSAGSSEFYFEDAYPFQQLFTAVAELCGLKGKMAATGYALPDIGGDDSDDEGEEA